MQLAGYVKFILHSIFSIVGVAAIFSTFQGVAQVIANISWSLHNSISNSANTNSI